MNYQVALSGLPAAVAFVLFVLCFCVGLVVVGENVVRFISTRWRDRK